jgi:hypothetical protein
MTARLNNAHSYAPEAVKAMMALADQRLRVLHPHAFH